MGPSSSTATANSTRYVHKSQVEGDATGKVYVCSRMVGGPTQSLRLSGVHHFILVSVPSMDKWVIHEWLDSKSSQTGQYRHSYACTNVNGWKCCYLGEFTLDEVLTAAKKVSKGRVYACTSSRNCNWWCEQVASELGWNITVNLNCSCVWGSRIKDACN